MPPVWDDKWIPALAKMTEKVTAHGGTPWACSLLHGGRQAFHQGRVAPLAPALFGRGQRACPGN